MSESHENGVQLFAVTPTGPQPLTVPQNARNFDELYHGLSLGVYSALRTFKHEKFLCLQEHIERTTQSMALLGWDYQLDETLLRQTIHQLCVAYPGAEMGAEMRVRFDVLAEPAVSLGSDSRVLVALMPFSPPSPELYEKGVAVDFAPDLVRQQPLAKTAVFAQRRQQYPAGKADVYEYLMMDENGRLLEGTSTNFYAVRDGVVYTAGEGVLEGITRKIILDLLPEIGIPVRLQAITVPEINSLDEAFLTGSSRAVLPVVSIAGSQIGNGTPGAIGRRLLMAYNDFVARSIKTAVTA
ncbi:MAG: aminotransferase class IV [Anaerolineae bacterium]|nr:aminotransferase class IV [Anaerolineae bacterium]